MNVETKYIRNGSTIYSVKRGKDGRPVETHLHASINAAKRESAEMQKKNGGLGAGYVRLDR